MNDIAYDAQRRRIEQYFDRTAVQAWERLTSDAPVGRIRATVRAGRDAMRALLLDALPADLQGASLLDAGCGTGSLSIEAARRGADVLGVDISPKLVAIANERSEATRLRGSVRFIDGDMIAHDRTFDHVVAMDSVIHYERGPMLDVLAALASCARHTLQFTVAPRTPMLRLMHASGKLFPRSDRSPSIVPVDVAAMRRTILSDPRFAGWRLGRTRRVHRGFYISEAHELLR